MSRRGRFTVADISVGYALMLLKIIELFDQAPESLRAYYERLQGATGVQAGEGGAEVPPRARKAVRPPAPSDGGESAS